MRTATGRAASRSTFVLLFSILVFASDGSAECDVPRHSVVEANVNTLGEGFAHVVVPPEAFTKDGLVCLADHLAGSQKRWRDVSVLFFSSAADAPNYDFGSRHTTGRYVRALLRIDGRSRTLALTPFGMSDLNRFVTEIPWPTPDTLPPCRLQVDGRCLLAAAYVSYPMNLLKQGTAARVALTARIGRDGRVQDAAVTETTPAADPVLVAEALANLRSWWFEPASRESRLRIDYAYVIDPSLPDRKEEPVLEEAIRRRNEEQQIGRVPSPTGAPLPLLWIGPF
jgi:hypothetical protein